ncbi:MAG: hemolysin family protein [Acidobacteriota bacterium]
MDNAYQVVFILVAFLLVFVNGFFVTSEFSIVKVRETRLQELIRQGNRRAKRADRLIQSMDEYLSATQLGITFASLGLGWIGEPAFARLFQPALGELGLLTPALAHTLSVGAAFLLITFLHIVQGELAPKSLAIRKPEGAVLWTAGPLIWFYKISYPFIWVLNRTADFCLERMGLGPGSEADLAHSEEELRLLLSYSRKQGILDRDQERMLERVFEFANRSVRQVMVPSVEVRFLDTQEGPVENLALARKEKHTRYPLCDGSLDRVVGIVHVKDLFRNYELIGPGFELNSLMRPVHFVPESKDIKSLLTEFRKSRIHLAVVVDEFGSTLGIVTLEDILEELVGEIQDEFDLAVPPEMVRKTDHGHSLVHGRALLEQVETELGLRLQDEENDTIAGHLMMLLGRTARIGDEVVVADRYRVRVVGMKGLQITDLIFEPLPRPATGKKPQ